MKTKGIKIVEGPLELSDSSVVNQPSDGFGRLYKKPGDTSLYWKGDSIGPETNITTAASSAASINLPVSQTGHGFIPGNAVYLSGSTFHLASASDLETIADAVVIDVGDANNFTASTAGEVTLTPLQWSGVIGTSGMTLGTHYYLSNTTPGSYTTTEPGISQRLLVARSASTAYLLNEITTLVHRNIQITNNASGTISSVYGSQIPGKYEIFDKSDPLLEATIYYNGTNMRVQSFDSRISVTPHSSNTLNIYQSGNIYIQNKTGSSLDLSIYRKAI